MLDLLANWQPRSQDGTAHSATNFDPSAHWITYFYTSDACISISLEAGLKSFITFCYEDGVAVYILILCNGNRLNSRLNSCPKTPVLQACNKPREILSFSSALRPTSLVRQSGNQAVYVAVDLAVSLATRRGYLMVNSCTSSIRIVPVNQPGPWIVNSRL